MAPSILGEDFYMPLTDLEIRVLDLLPGKLNAVLQANLRIVRLGAEDSHYEALSYTWGSQTDNRVIHMNGCNKSTSITKHLFQALQRLRRRQATRTLWVDALCINQNDLSERSTQVAIMSEIYRAATCVNIWLGEPDRSWYINVRHLGKVMVWRPIPSGEEPSDLRRYRRWAMWKTLCGYLDAMESALRNNSPYWYNRAWVLQEFIMSRRAYLCFGSRSLLWRYHYIFDLQSVIRHGGLGMGHSDRLIEKLNKCRLAKEASRRPGLVSAMYYYARNTSATDPRDKIYSLLGLVNEDEAKLIGVDYSIKPRQLFAKTTFICLQLENDWTILAAVTLKGDLRQSLPSWVIDFTDIQSVDSSINAGTLISPDLGQPKQRSGCFVAVDPSFSFLTLEFAQVIHDFMCQVLCNITAIQHSETSRGYATCTAQRSRDILNMITPAQLYHSYFWKTRTPSVQEVIRKACKTWQTIGACCEAGSSPASHVSEMSNDDFVSGDLTMLNISWDLTQVAAGGTSLIATSLGYIGLAPSTVTRGDRLAVGPGGEHPLLFRAVADHYVFQGIASIWGVSTWAPGRDEPYCRKQWRQRFLQGEDGGRSRLYVVH
ncbi:hypothetical protein LTR86_010631 [Recurvomyces mirabilis]|nr:hypothetical protein LTR86_010631 [Recurvomyces mirabilis]